MKIVAFSDTHGKHELLTVPAGDAVIFAGDCCMHGTFQEAMHFLEWFAALPHPIKIMIAGNHDWYLQDNHELWMNECDNRQIDYLVDAANLNVIKKDSRFESLMTFGSPYTPQFGWWAFMRERGEEIARHWSVIPTDLDVLITHGPPYGVLDAVEEYGMGAEYKHINVGCEELRGAVEAKQPRVHIFGHIHGQYGAEVWSNGQRFYNVSVVNERYDVVNPCTEIEL